MSTPSDSPTSSGQSTTGDVALSSVPANTRQNSAFHQTRLKLFGLVGFAISSTFWLKDFGTRLAEGVSWQACTADSTRIGHGAATLVLLGIFLATKHKKYCSERSLMAFDVVALLVACAGFVFSMYGQMAKNPYAAVVLATLITGVVLMTRAIIVPTTARAAVAINSLACIPVLVLAYLAMDLAPADTPTGEPLASTVIWSLSFVFLATLASKVFHGLRERVREARQLGQYTLEEKIGEGGMGQVYRASHAMLRRPTAVKLLPPGRVSPRQLARFEREVQRTAELTHPNTISVYDYGRTPDGVFYYAMEFLDGLNLEDLVHEHGPQPADRVIHILQQACGALAEAHEQGLIHRDVKPANLFLCRRGGEHDVVKVLDFGLVREVSRDGANLSIGDMNVITGTPAYMPPEAIKSPDEIDGRSDIYSLGAVGYFLLTGEPVFGGSTPVEICAAHLHETPDPPSDRLGAALPDDLVEAIMACLAKDPAARPETARVLRERLDECGDAHDWNEARAAAWWNQTEPAPPSPRLASPSTGTIDIDLHGRLAPA
jgi:eukaryotic-like serine/threonine-protein kinase